VLHCVSLYYDIKDMIITSSLSPTNAVNAARAVIVLNNYTRMKFETFFFCMLKLSMMTPMKRLSVKNEPKTMKKTKYKYIQSRTSRWCCSSFYSTLTIIITNLNFDRISSAHVLTTHTSQVFRLNWAQSRGFPEK